jgi:hypothetical protein
MCFSNIVFILAWANALVSWGLYYVPPAKVGGYENTNLVTEYLYNCVSVTLHFSAGIVDSELVLCFNTIFFIEQIVCLGKSPSVVGYTLYHQLKQVVTEYKYA